MESLSKLLSRLRQSLGSDALTKEIIVNSIKEVLGFELRIQDISIKWNVLRIQTSPAKRSEIKLNESKLIEIIRERTKLNIKTIVY